MHVIAHNYIAIGKLELIGIHRCKKVERFHLMLQAPGDHVIDLQASGCISRERGIKHAQMRRISRATDNPDLARHNRIATRQNRHARLRRLIAQPHHIDKKRLKPLILNDQRNLARGFQLRPLGRHRLTRLYCSTASGLHNLERHRTKRIQLPPPLAPLFTRLAGEPPEIVFEPLRSTPLQPRKIDKRCPGRFGDTSTQTRNPTSHMGISPDPAQIQPIATGRTGCKRNRIFNNGIARTLAINHAVTVLANRPTHKAQDAGTEQPIHRKWQQQNKSPIPPPRYNGKSNGIPSTLVQVMIDPDLVPPIRLKHLGGSSVSRKQITPLRLKVHKPLHGFNKPELDTLTFGKNWG